MDRQQLLARIERRWQELAAAFSGLDEAELTRPGVTETWSVTDILAHVAVWEAETLRILPLLADGGRPPRYKGGIDGFNAEQTARHCDLTPDQARGLLLTTHARLLDYLGGVPEALFAGETRFRHRLRLDTYGHYPEHTQAILAWREAQGL